VCTARAAWDGSKLGSLVGCRAGAGPSCFVGAKGRGRCRIACGPRRSVVRATLKTLYDFAGVSGMRICTIAAARSCVAARTGMFRS